jgi:hypothetical protein
MATGTTARTATGTTTGVTGRESAVGDDAADNATDDATNDRACAVAELAVFIHRGAFLCLEIKRVRVLNGDFV